jgi:hypothetical protein
VNPTIVVAEPFKAKRFSSVTGSYAADAQCAGFTSQNPAALHTSVKKNFLDFLFRHTGRHTRLSQTSVMTTGKEPIMNLHSQLNRLAQRVAEEGSLAEREALTTLASAVLDLKPGAAAALTDWDGAEVARLRAFAIAQGALRDADPTLQERVSLLLGSEIALTLAA